jgi:hypothetical protein
MHQKLNQYLPAKIEEKKIQSLENLSSAIVLFFRTVLFILENNNLYLFNEHY